ncbi:hypothetical protein EIL87_26285 [Saccharopolyspora rhizosphaerae]|uniref:Uncharacterized protein n=1 Tax=Saccharopolyspora rhizosphaerae TaxID=2492662 RepID=A0A426JJ11_9PSEU|nr:hypothetical protein [Saccharopolyspora rhizosphaerae]RRO13148.1 hypothetical protein EIL87_26285 [Saccharopolyspora rhizosphaerae]
MANDGGDGWQGTRRRPHTPLPIWVHLARALPPQRGIGYGRTPLRVRAGGIDIAATVPGVLVAWHQTSVGDWWALATFEMTNRTGKPAVVVTQLVPAAAVSPRQGDPR